MDKEEKMIEEYKLCQQVTQLLESTIWRTSGVIGIGSLTALFYVASKIVKAPSLQEKLVFLCAGIVVVITVWIWWFMAKRWWDVQHITFDRMRDIEEDLETFFQIRYISFKDGTRDVCSVDPEILGNGNKELGLIRKGKLKMDHRFSRKGVQKSLKWFVYVVTMAWFLLIDFQLLLTLKPFSIPLSLLVGIAIVWVGITGGLLTK